MILDCILQWHWKATIFIRPVPFFKNSKMNFRFQILLILLPILIFGEDKKLGVVFSPLIRKSDRHNTQTYTVDIVKTMLEVIVDAGFSAITTYGVGSPNTPYHGNATLSECSSFVHTAMATALLNKEKDSLALVLFQGIYNSTYEDQVNCEIEVSLETARQANAVFDGSVPSIIYPSLVQFNDLIDNDYIRKKLAYVSGRVRNIKLKMGTRSPDCQNIPTRSAWKVMSVLKNLDFIICSISPDESKFKFGYENFENYAELLVLQTEDYIRNTLNSTTEVILETGWPGDSNLKSPNSVEDEKMFWQEMEIWAREKKKTVFLTEAFDSPWKAEHPEWPLAAYFGRWKYNEAQPNLLKRDAYILKKDYDPPLVKKLFGGFWLTLVGIFAGVLVLVFFISIIALLIQRVNRIEKVTAILSEQDVNFFMNGVIDDDPNANEYMGKEWEKSPYNKTLEINKTQLIIDKSKDGLLGKGEFGCVYKAVYIISGDSSVEVAVKMTKSQCSSQSELKSILSEIKILAYVGQHKHVCGIVGAYTEEISRGTVYLATEFCGLGSLEQHLRKNGDKFKSDLKGKPTENIYVSTTNGYMGEIASSEIVPLSEFQLLRWCHEIACAMEYISSKNVIHSDLATRNILLTVEYITKITDFGLSRRLLEDDDLYSKKGSEPLPWKWLAPESLDCRQFSTKSDVWSYAVSVWEIFSIGGVPKYEGVTNWSELLPVLKKGKRMERPEFASDDIYTLLLKCWSFESTDRPCFDVIVSTIAGIISGEYTDMVESQTI